MAIDVDQLPEVPKEQRPKVLYVDQNVESEAYVALKLKGWEVVDLRLEPETTDAERAENVKNWLAGVRLGSIQPSVEKLKHVELEASVYGLKNAKSAATTKRSAEEDKDIVSLLSFNSPRAFRGTQFATQEVPTQVPQKRGRGRPRKNSGVS